MVIIGVNARTLGAHLGGWRHPDSWHPTMMNLKNTILCAQIAERGKLDLIFLADGNGVRQMDKPALFTACSPSDRPAVFEPVTMLSAIAMVTEHIGLVATATTSYEEPYTLARKFASLDHISNGRAGWNLVTTSNAEDALNFGKSEHMPRDIRYERAREFVDVVRGLWDSWEPDAFPQDQAAGKYLDPSKVHLTNHQGKYFSVRGPLNVARAPQGHPLIFQAGQSEGGKELAAATADCIFGGGGSKEESIALYADIKGRMDKYGRRPETLKILPGAGVYVGRTEGEAEELFQELQALIPEALGLEYLSKNLDTDLSGYPLDGPLPELAPEKVGGVSSRYNVAKMAAREGLSIRQTYQRVLGAAGGTMLKGTPKQIADEIEDWHASKACDGFIIGGAIMPRCLEDFVDLVVPELQRRGLFRREYEGKTLRENLGLPAAPPPAYARAKVEMAMS
jgi:alkanesulfonate monooxygenase